MVEQLESRIAEHNGKEEAQKEINAATKAQLATRQTSGTPQISTRGIAQVKKRPTKTSRTGIPDEPVSTKFDPSATDRRTQPPSKRVVVASAAPVHHTTFHSIATNKNARSAARTETSTKPLRSKNAGARFNSLRHMNNAQKRAKEIPIPLARKHSAINVANGESETTKVQSPIQQQPADDSLLFFTDESQLKRGHDLDLVSRKPDEPAPSAEVEHRFTLQDSHAHPARRYSASSNVAPVPGADGDLNRRTDSYTETLEGGSTYEPPSLPQKAIIRTTGGRVFTQQEILIQFHFGDHDLGDVLILNFPKWLKAALVRLKGKGSAQLPLRFDQALIFKAQDFARISSHWPSEPLPIGVIKPYPDTAPAIWDLSTYLEHENCAVIWEHPKPDDTIGFLLYSPNAPGWKWRLTRPSTTNMREVPLVLEAVSRARRGERPTPVPRQHIQPTMLSSQTPPSMCQPAPTLTSARPIQQNRRASTHDAGFTGLVVHSPPVTQTEALVPTDHITTDDRSWTVAADFKSLMDGSSSQSNTKPFVFIAFKRFFPEQGKALRTWAASHTSSRFIYADDDDDGCGSLEDFRCSKNPAIFLFHDAVTNFCELRDLWQLLGRENVFCYNVSWTPPEDGSELVSYGFSKLFPSGSALLVTERMMIEYGRETIAALDWFKRNAKKETWQIMVRPRVRGWLQQKAIQTHDPEKQQRLFDILGCLYRLSSYRDVTIADHNDRLEDLGVSQEPQDVNYIVPLPVLKGYDDSEDAAGDPGSLSQRDDVLVQHFVHWSMTEACKVSRRFIVLDDNQAKLAKGKVEAGHVRFAMPDAFVTR